MSGCAATARTKPPGTGIRPADSSRVAAQQFVSFRLDRQMFGVEVGLVQEVLPPPPVTRAPKAPPEVIGLLNLRGQIVTAIDLRRRMHLPPAAPDRPGMHLVVRQRHELFSLLVDEVGDVISVEGDAFDPTPHTLDPHWKSLMTGVFRLDGRLFVILNVACVVKLD